MKQLLSRKGLALLIVFGIVIADQLVKIIIKTSMLYHEEIRIADWFYIHFLENPGFAFGMQFIPKTVLTLSRAFFSCLIAWYLVHLVKEEYKRGYIVCIALILAGAIGNVIDCLFYGALFSESTPTQVAALAAPGEGYADWLTGRVVDMFYFPLFEFDWPGWMPLIGGRHFLFFSPVFNVADAAVSCGVIAMILFYRNTLSESMETMKRECKNSRFFS